MARARTYFGPLNTRKQLDLDRHEHPNNTQKRVQLSRINMTAMTSSASLTYRTAAEYIELCKPKVVVLLVFTALVGMFLAVPGMVPLQILVFGTLGIGLAAASGAAFNHVIDRRIDALMQRTSDRPLPTGHLDYIPALVFAVTLSAVSMLLLVAFVNWLTAVLTLLSMVAYAVVYTVYLKHMTPQNIVIGGAAGAMPPVLGWTAVTNTVDPHALLLFLIIFAWTPPHFWALAIHRADEYARAEVPMLPVTHGVAFTRWQILFYTVLLIVASVLPYITRMSGVIYLISALILGAVFLYYAAAMLLNNDARLPMRTFGYSIVYLTGMFTALLVDHYVPITFS
ncbi:MAG: protoheme IX farnesyltransferase [Gammaproteobacteria bacterium]